MNFAILGGTHGNEPIGVHVIQHFKSFNQKTFLHHFETFHANPKAFQKKVRYIDSDLNRAFGSEIPIEGNEKNESIMLKNKIIGKFNFIIDLHTTTSNMGITVIITHLDSNSLNAACSLKLKFPELKIIISMRAGKDCPYTTQMTSSALTIEVGPVANNVVKAELVLKTIDLVEALLNFPFNQDFKNLKFDCYQTKGIIHYPSLVDQNTAPWFVHPELEGKDFIELKKGSPVFINSLKNTIYHEGNAIYPLFINEAAYQENNIAMEYADKLINFELFTLRQS